MPNVRVDFKILILAKENVFKMLLVFDKIFDKMNDVDKRKLIESMIAEVHLHPKETWEEGKCCIRRDGGVA